MKLHNKILALSDVQLIQLSTELQQTVVSENALIREVIKDTEVDTTVPAFAFVSVNQILSFVLANRLQSAINDLALYEKHGYDIRELREIDSIDEMLKLGYT